MDGERRSVGATTAGFGVAELSTQVMVMVMIRTQPHWNPASAKEHLVNLTTLILKDHYLIKCKA